MKRKADAGTTTRPFFVRAEWDAEACVWVATSDDVPGLATEAASLEKLTAKLKVVIPELIALNRTATRRRVIAFEVLSRSVETVRLAG
jgi:predicted RNase H-like HicB family nuclease